MKTIIYLTLFPEYFHNYFQISLAKKALKTKMISYLVYNLRDFAKKGRVDDYIFGGGTGMLLKIEPLVNALTHIQKNYPKSYFILLSPQGKRLTQKEVVRITNMDSDILFICGRYEGFDARLLHYVDEQISIGDFVTMGGEIPALIITDAVIRTIPDMIKKESYQQDSFTCNKFDFDSYTRPKKFRDLKVPEILLSGNHKKIKEWRDINIREKIKNPKGQYRNKKKITLI